MPGSIRVVLYIGLPFTVPSIRLSYSFGDPKRDPKERTAIRTSAGVNKTQNEHPRTKKHVLRLMRFLQAVQCLFAVEGSTG